MTLDTRLTHLTSTVTGHHGGTPMVSAHAKAETPFGVMASRTAVHVDRMAEDLAQVTFTVGTTPVQVTLSGGNLHGLIRELAACANELTAARLLATVSEVPA